MANQSCLTLSLVVSLVAFVAVTHALPVQDAIVQAMSIAKSRLLPYSEPKARDDGYKLSFEPYPLAFEEFKSKFGVYYDSDAEEAYRFSIFRSNVRQMEVHNFHYHVGRRSFFQHVNQFSDKTMEEYRAYNRLGRYSSAKGFAQRKDDPSLCRAFTPGDESSDPASFDWREKGKVTNVKDQGQCGSCWTFSATGSIEGSYAILSGRLLSFSEQQIVDCCQLQSCSGCNGGLMDAAFTYTNQTGGLETEGEYGYTAHNDDCQFLPSEVKVHVVGCEDIPSGDEAALKNAIATKGPVSVGIDANSGGFMNYGGGVFYNEDCSSTDLDHGVLAVGYGTQDGQDYWIVKNSWTSRWGLNGYILMARNRGNNCGIATSASFPHTAKP